jgi:hypothetical protein
MAIFRLRRRSGAACVLFVTALTPLLARELAVAHGKGDAAGMDNGQVCAHGVCDVGVDILFCRVGGAGGAADLRKSREQIDSVSAFFYS